MADLSIIQNVPTPGWFPVSDAAATLSQAFARNRTRERWKYTPLDDVLPLLGIEGRGWTDVPRPDGISISPVERHSSTLPLQLSPNDTPEACAALCLQPRVWVANVQKTPGEPWRPLPLGDRGLFYSGKAPGLFLRA